MFLHIFNTNLQLISGKALYPLFDMLKLICSDSEDGFCVEEEVSSETGLCSECFDFVTGLAYVFTDEEDNLLNLILTVEMSLYLEASFLTLVVWHC